MFLLHLHENTVSYKQHTTGKINDMCLDSIQKHQILTISQYRHITAMLASEQIQHSRHSRHVFYRQTVAESWNTNVISVHNKCMMLCESRATFHVSKCTKQSTKNYCRIHSASLVFCASQCSTLDSIAGKNEPNLSYSSPLNPAKTQIRQSVLLLHHWSSAGSSVKRKSSSFITSPNTDHFNSHFTNIPRSKFAIK